MAAADENFAGAGVAPGLELWRIENMVPVKQPEVTGKFYSGDSYILLSTAKAKHGNALEWSLHFWLGKDTSQDESGVAAYKTVELDESLGGGPIQYREVESHESDLFMSYFKSTGLEYLPGGVASGFTHVERDVYETRLLQCKGKRAVRVNPVPVASASLNIGDCFILDMGLQLFLYNGVEANKYEKSKAFDVVHKLHNERGAKGEIVIINEDPHNAAFWEALGGEIEVTSTGDDDAAASAQAAAETKLFKVDGDDGTIQVTEVPKDGQGNFTRDMLDTDDAYILDAGSSLFVWIGKTASAAERKESMIVAQKYISDTGKPHHTPVERVVQSAESTIFKSYFYQFDPVMTPDMMRARSASTVAAMPEQKEINMGAMHARKAAGETPIDDGSGKLEIWLAGLDGKTPVAAEKYGQFYGGDSYILLYTYMAGNREEYIIYFWQGKDSTKDEIGASALLAKDLDDEMGGAPVQVRVVQGKEPNHFRQLFKGKMIVHEGGKASGFKNSDQEDQYDDDGISLFHVRGSNPLNTYGTQVAEVAASLNSQDCFVLVTPSIVFSWNGSNANEAEIATALSIAEVLKGHSYGPPGSAAPARTVSQISEGEEPEEFWTGLGGQGEYPQMGPGEPAPAEPRLFQCSNAFGSFTVEEVVNFTQEDMLDDDVMLLDIGTTLYAWIGSGANAKEKEMALETAKQYNETATDGRSPDTPIVKVNSGREPVMFTQYFPGWDPELYEKNKFLDPYEAKLAAMKKAKAEAAGEEYKEEPVANAPAAAGAATLNPDGGFLPFTTVFSYADLASGIPEGVDPTKKEMYLSDAEFTETFGMDKTAFAALPAWKAKTAKKKFNLF